ncbi:hypothetical protein B0I08_103333 [Glaciihabitans tibetensis]|uniref:Lipoprotein n=1 Tax=Glaciihabitans tibetensis TaxID=1266600 RepID=A0A2T0VFY3_9MICO|nr:hypothetical protein [Glaciihabitans tibetensis]PRY69127.1 hypothetical protein B0I08_103333 [Glaciihabitans tibetensis]
MSLRGRRTTRTYAACALALGVAASLTGCLGETQPGPTAVSSGSASNCTPDTASIFWDEKMEGPEVKVGAYLLTDMTGEASERPAPDIVDLDTAPEYTGDGLNQLTDFDAELRETWESALLEDARQTGQVARDFGEPSRLPAAPNATMVAEAPGTVVQVVTSPQLSMPFEIQCSGMDPVEGSIRSVLTSSVGNTFFICDEPFEETTEQAEYARELCLTF